MIKTLEEVFVLLLKLDFNSAFLLGGISVVVIGGLVYWFMNKSDTEEKITENLEDLVPEIKNLIEVFKLF